jgi:hypothetical protein
MWSFMICTNVVRVTKSRIMRWVGHLACMVEEDVRTGFWWGEGKRPLGNPRRRWEDNIKTHLQVEWEHGLDSSGSG